MLLVEHGFYELAALAQQVFLVREGVYADYQRKEHIHDHTHGAYGKAQQAGGETAYEAVQLVQYVLGHLANLYGYVIVEVQPFPYVGAPFNQALGVGIVVFRQGFYAVDQLGTYYHYQHRDYGKHEQHRHHHAYYPLEL